MRRLVNATRPQGQSLPSAPRRVSSAGGGRTPAAGCSCGAFGTRLCWRRRGREAAVEGLAALGHLAQQPVGPEARAVCLGEALAERDESLAAHAVDVGQRAAAERRKAKAEDGPHVGLANVRQDAFLKAACGLQRLNDQEALLQLREIE